jgi:hypothetical protein
MDAQRSAYEIESYYVSNFVKLEKWFVWDFAKVRLFKMNFKKKSINSAYGSFRLNFDWVVISASTSQMLRMGVVKSVIAKLKIAEIHEIKKNGGSDRS